MDSGGPNHYTTATYLNLVLQGCENDNIKAGVENLELGLDHMKFLGFLLN